MNVAPPSTLLGHPLSSQIADALRGATGDGELVDLVVASVTRLLGVQRCEMHLGDRPGDVRIDGLRREWGDHAVLVVPMIVQGEELGALLVDRDELTDRDGGDEDLVEAAAKLAGVLIRQASRAAECRSKLAAVARQHETLRQASSLSEQLSDLVIAGAGVNEIAERVADLTSKPTAVFDASARCVAWASAGVGDDAEDADEHLPPHEICGHPVVQRAIVGIDPTRPRVIGPFEEAGIQCRLLVAPVGLGGFPPGYLMLGEHGPPLSQVDALVARRAAAMIAGRLATERRVSDALADARETVTRDLLRASRTCEALKTRAVLHGFHLDESSVVIYVAPASPDHELRLPSHAVTAAFASVVPGDVPFVAEVDGGIAAIVALGTDVPSAVAIGRIKLAMPLVMDALAASRPLFAAVSPVCRTLQDLPSAFVVSKQIADNFSGSADGRSAMVMAADDLGAFRLLLNPVGRIESERFVRDALGPLLERDEPWTDGLLATVHAFAEASWSVRRAAERVGVHENTIRYRLARIAEMTGLDVASDPDDQTTAQLALMVLRLDGRLPVFAGWPAGRS